MIKPNNQIREDVKEDLRVTVLVKINKTLQDTRSLRKNHEVPRGPKVCCTCSQERHISRGCRVRTDFL
jgi:hypothetical protein